MSPEEWAPIAAFMENAWKDELDDVRSSAYLRALGHVPAEFVDEAVTRLAGGRALSAPPASAGGHYLPSAEAIARECAALQFVGTWDWAYQALGRLLLSHEYEAACGPRASYRLYDSDWTPQLREEVAQLHPDHGLKLVGLVESFGLGYVSRHRASGHFMREGRRRWAHLTLEAIATSTGTALIDPRAT